MSQEVEMASSKSTLVNPLSQLGFRAFPPEITELIFADLLKWTGKTPALLIALRGDQLLYQEAMTLFCKLNTFKLHKKNSWKTGDMAVSGLQKIRTLEVEFWSSEDWEEWDYNQEIEPSIHSFATHPILRATSLQTIHFNVSNLSEFNMKASLLPAVALSQSLPHLRELSVALPPINYHRSSDEYDKTGLVSDMIEDFNFYLGVNGKLRSVCAAVEPGERMVWFWTSECGACGGLRESTRQARRRWESLPEGVKDRDASIWYHVCTSSEEGKAVGAEIR